MNWPDYELLDFGAGRRLERFGAWVLDRPCPAAVGVAQAEPALWSTATARFDGERAAAGTWRPAPAKWPQREQSLQIPPSLEGRGKGRDLLTSPRSNGQDPSVDPPLTPPCKGGGLHHTSSFSLALEPLPSGQIGVFPEQFANWHWIADCVRRLSAQRDEPLRVLNLFAYTGGSTLAAAAAGAQVVHVDAAKSVVARARANAAASGLADAPIRWLVEDAARFCQREVKRGNRYDAVVLDPPSYGHGPGGEEWRVDRDLLPLVELCGELVNRQPAFFLATCHSPGIGPAELSAILSDGVCGHCAQPPRTGELTLIDRAGRPLPSGVYARWPR